MTQPIAGRNSRLDEIQAAILRVKLRHLDCWNERRAHLTKAYDQRLMLSTRVTPLKRCLANGSANHLYVIRTESRDELRSFLEKRGIQTIVHYPEPLHLQPLFNLRGGHRNLPIAEAACAQILSLPMNSHSFDWEIEATADTILEFDRL